MCANISERQQIELRVFIEDGGTSYSGWPMKPRRLSEAEGLSLRRATRMFLHAFEWNKWFFS